MSSTGPSFCGVCSRNLDDEVLNDGEFMIQCDVCEIWYHGKCVELEEYESADIDLYHCPSCLPQAGPSRPKRITNHHRYDYSDPDAADKPTENGTLRFIQELKKRRFQDATNKIAVLENGHLLTSTYLDQTKFQTPIIVENPAGLGLVVPPSSFTVDDVEKRVGGDRYVDVIDVYSQHSYKMRLRTFLNYFRDDKRPKLYNLISLECSDTELSKLIKIPDVIDELSWVDQYWPKPLRDDLSSAQKLLLNEHIGARPEVSKFCLIGMAESYTDFHIDFGGTSVFYHVLWGEKVFYLIDPSEKNLRLFENWQRSPGSSERFFGDLVANCYRLELKPGQTFFIPTGWIHAVYTPTDALVIGGNFLHSFNIGLQIRIYEMEKSINTADKFMFPHFELMNWYAGVHFLDVLKELNEEKTPAKPYLLDGLKEMVSAMKTWVQRNQGHMRRSKLSGQIIIETMTCAQVLKQLERAVQTNEKLSAITKTKRLKNSDVITKMQQVQDQHSAATTSKATSIKLALPLPKLKIPSRGTFERAKGCPKSPAKIKQQVDIINAVAKLPTLPEEKTSLQGSKKSRIKVHSPKDMNLGNDPKIVIACDPETTEFTTGTDSDSAPPTPGCTDSEFNDTGDRLEISADKQSEKLEHGELKKATSIAVDNHRLDNQDNSNSPEKKSFGFSLLEMKRDEPTSPLSPVGRRRESSNPVMSPPPLSTTSPFKTDLRFEKCSRPDMQTVSSRGRKSKPNHHVIGRKPSGVKTEFYPDLGYCRQDDEFVYPSLSDSEPSDLPVKKQRKSSSHETTPRKAESSQKLKLNLSILPHEKKTVKVRVDKPKKPKLPQVHSDTSGTISEMDTSKIPSASNQGATGAKMKKHPKGTTKQRLAKALKIRKLIPM